ncbi:DUF3265 domain-containing protein [Vibrio metoecus]|nr:DUF3265 domain-containing protein [Vibrio metoecus]PAR59788.1 DUF3265 domain-containing protein [Vibrio metoecus]
MEYTIDVLVYQYINLIQSQKLCSSGLIKHFKVVLESKLTNCLRVIRNAWHFCYALRFVFKVVCGNSGIALLTP